MVRAQWIAAKTLAQLVTLSLTLNVYPTLETSLAKLYHTLDFSHCRAIVSFVYLNDSSVLR